MVEGIKDQPEWVVRGKTIGGLIRELETFEDKNLKVEISIDGGETRKPISLVIRDGACCVLMNCEDNSVEGA